MKILVLFILLILLAIAGNGQLYPEPEKGLLAGQADNPMAAGENGLLFYLSGENEFRADFAAGGQDKPNYLKSVRIIGDGAIGRAFEADDDQLFTYWAPGNIYAQRGTLAFFWRSRYPVGPTAFPVFRVAFADHTSWDMAWLRIDYNGSGFDAFVTDVGLTRTRVSHYMDQFPAPGEWTHVAFSWDETQGVRLYINGERVEEKTVEGKVFDTGLDQFGPHSRIISPYQVQSLYSFKRGGDLDELRIYDRMLSDENILHISRGIPAEVIPELNPDLDERRWRDAWWDRHGWNLPNDPPPELPSDYTSVKKVGIHEAYDVRRWIWKANDGIRETTWPGVYNMSRLPGRYDYFVYPDWDCYSMSGQSVEFEIPDEPWNHVEIWGKAWGQLTWEKEHAYDLTFGVKTREQVKSYHRLEVMARGGRLRFDNALIEEPIGELGVYLVNEGRAPRTQVYDSYTLRAFAAGPGEKGALNATEAFIYGRYPESERCLMTGSRQSPTIRSNKTNRTGSSAAQPAGETEPGRNTLPFIHIIIPYEEHPGEGLDGIEISLPALDVVPTHGDLYALNLRIKDPLWAMRDLADFSFSVLPGNPQTIWVDTRDRLLPEGKDLYITLAGSGKGLSPSTLAGTELSLVYKPRDEALAEHELDRFTQIRDLYGFTVEERPLNPRLNLYNRFVADQTDLMKANPDHWLGQAYLYANTRNRNDRPEYKIPEATESIPEWAFLQKQYMQHLANIVNYYIDKRQISNGEFGGGLSDDDDFSNFLVGAAMMGIEPEKIRNSLRLLLESYYDQDRDSYDAGQRQRSLPLFTNGLATIITDQLHAYEEGMEAVGQLMLMDYGNPVYMARGMEISKRILEDVTQIAPDGHRHFRSRLYGGTGMSTEDPWQWSGYHSYNVLHTAYLVARYNGNPSLKKMIIEIADGLLAHRGEDGKINTDVHFTTGEVRDNPGMASTWQVLLAAYDFTGEQKYLEPIDRETGRAVQFDEEDISGRYREIITELAVREYINTEGSIWIDRISANSNDLQEDRLGGIALARIRNIYQRNFLSWKIHKPAAYENLAVFTVEASPFKIQAIVYNMDSEKINADVALWGIKPGQWKVQNRAERDKGQDTKALTTLQKLYLEKGSTVSLEFDPGQYSYISLELLETDPEGYEDRADLAISPADIRIAENQLTVRVYSQGAKGSPETTLELRDAGGERISIAKVPAMDAPLDLIPRWVDVVLQLAPGADLTRGSLEVDPDHEIKQITRLNTLHRW